MELTCPKCHGTMRTYERNGVHVDQCTDCRGIFLDRGELDRLIDAENTWHEGGGRKPAASSSDHRSSEHRQSGYPPQGGHSDGGLGAVVSEVLGQVRGQKHSSHDRHYDDDRRYDDRRYSKKRKESFLGDLFG
jgi:Zn-finger nucleic acid-binding protein